MIVSNGEKDKDRGQAMTMEFWGFCKSKPVFPWPALLKCEGITHFSQRVPADIAPEIWRSQLRCDAFCEAVICYAGPYAEARHRKRTATSILIFKGGYGDLEDAERAIKFVADDENDETALHEAAEAEANDFIRDREIWAAINGLADLLQARGKVEFDEPDVQAIVGKIKRLRN
jgi:hypothetical protein